jgi:hypothetical protein
MAKLGILLPNFSNFPLGLSVLQHPVLSLNVSVAVLQQSVLPRRVLHAASGRVSPPAACAAFEQVCTTPACVAA